MSVACWPRGLIIPVFAIGGTNVWVLGAATVFQQMLGRGVAGDSTETDRRLLRYRPARGGAGLLPLTSARFRQRAGTGIWER